MKVHYLCSIVLLLSHASTFALKDPAFVIVGGSDKDSSIAFLKIDGTKGHLSFSSSSPAGGNAPSFMAWHYKRAVKQIYVGNRRPNARSGGGLTAVKWETDNANPGSPLANISLIASANTSIVDATHLTIHRSGKWAVIASTGNNSVGVVPLNLDPTSLDFISFGEPINLPPFSVGNFSHEALFDPSGKYLFVPCRNSDWVRMMVFDEMTGALTNNGPDSIAVLPPGSGPRHMVLHPTLPKAYVINEFGNSVALFDWDKATGRLSANFEKEANHLLSTLPLGAPDCSSTTECTQSAAEVIISPDGKFLYASNRGTKGGLNNIAIFSIDLNDSGLLTPLGYADGDGDIRVPRHMSLSHGKKGKFLLVANEDGNSVTVFARSKETGMLSKVMTESVDGVVGRPSFVAVVHPNTVSKSSAETTSRYYYFGNSYGNFCGAGNSQFGKKPINKLDRCCYFHDSCFTYNCSAEPGQCECNNNLLTCATAVSKRCGLSGSNMCRYARSVVNYAARAAACTC